MIENKKFKLNKENLDLLHLIQHIVFINISTYQSMSNQDWNDDGVVHTHELKCTSYLKLHCSYSTLNTWDDGLESFKVRTYHIRNNSMNVDDHYILRIELDKSYYDCCQLGMEIQNRIIKPVSINIFNIDFIHD